MTQDILIGTSQNGTPAKLLLKMANRHGLITGATGTGKTVTLQTLAEQFSDAGTPVILTDVKGDLSGLASPGKPHSQVDTRVQHNKMAGFAFKAYPTAFWDIFGKSGTPVRTTVTEMGPMLLSRIFDLNGTQTDIMHLIFKYSDDHGLLLHDLKDLKALLQELGEKAKELQLEYGNISKSSLGAILRRIVTLESGGGDFFFSEPALEVQHLMQKDFSGKGLINIIDAQKLMMDKRLYSSFLLWILSELFENLPEVGDPDTPKLVFFFDEAHLLFDDAPEFLVEKIETVVRLIRSKGVGLYFISQSPADIPLEVLNQLGNKIQHGLRASSEKDRKLIKSIAQNYSSVEGFDVEKAITSLGIGESLTSPLNEKGLPCPVEQVLHCPPQSQIGPIEPTLRQERIDQFPMKSLYEKSIDRESAYEVLKKRREESSKKEDSVVETEKKSTKTKTSTRQGPWEAFFKSVLRSVGSQLGRQIIRGVLGSIKK